MTAVSRPCAVVVVPCYNEASRLDAPEFLRLSESVHIWMVDDGSSDATTTQLAAIAARSRGRIRALANACNLGKAEAVRRHMLEACEAGAPLVGFFDADLATPVDELLVMLDLLHESGAEAVTAARVGLSGRDIQRSRYRHYTGRIFSTIASMAIGAPYYDTQCGAKLFRNSAALREALAEPFRSRWAFDVELLGRLVAGSHCVAPVEPGRLVEHPLHRWHDVAGSKLSPLDAWKSGLELILIWRDLAGRRKL